MVAPDIDILISDGATRPLRSLYKDGPVALLFLRHLNCIFCRQQVAQLKSYPDMNVAFVAMATPEEAREFAEEFSVGHPIVCDPDRALYRAFGLTDGNLYQMLSPRVMLRAIAALRQGNVQLRPKRHPKQLAGVFVIEPEGEVTWEYRATDASDNPTPAQIRAHLSVQAKA